MNAVILEDEELSARLLSNLLKEIDPSLKVERILESVENAVKWLRMHPQPSVIFMDIQLSDGLSFDIFKQVEIHSPVIFTTAYDEYALKAFKVNSIDYLLKPVDKEELRHSLHKLDELKWQYLGGPGGAVEKLLHSLDETKRAYKSRFLIKNGKSLITVFDKDVAYFLSDRKLTFLVTWSGKKHPLNESLEELEEKLDPRSFFRLNRQYIVNINSIESVHTFFNYRLKVILKPLSDQEVLVSREHVKAFKMWLNG